MDKKAFNLFFISLLLLFLVSAVSAVDIQDGNVTILSDGSNHVITSDLSNDDIQSQFGNANDGDTFEFTDKEYRDISLVVDKKLNIISKKSSVVYASDEVSDRARNMGIDKTFGFYFTSNAAGSVLSGITIIASNSDYGIEVDNSKNIKIINNKVIGGGNGVLIKNSDKITLSENDISKAKQNGVQLQNVKNSLIEKNYISYNKKSGIETSNIAYCKILNNTIHHNDLNGISTFNKSSNTLMSGNNVYENSNGIYINSTSTNEKTQGQAWEDLKLAMDCCLERDLKAAAIQYSKWSIIIWLIMNFSRPKTTGKIPIMNWARIGTIQMTRPIHLSALGFLHL